MKMRHRSETEIVYDMLDVIKNREMPTPLRMIFEGAKIVGHRMQLKYTMILEECSLAKLTGHTHEDKANITTKGIQYITFYDAIEAMLRSGFRDQERKKKANIP